MMGCWLSWLIRPLLKRMEHLYKNTNDLVASLRRNPVGESWILLKADVKDFYLTGLHRQLASAVASAFTGKFKLAVQEVLELLLYHQYVKTDNGDHYQLREGTGMGFTASGNIADIAFYILAEKPGLLLQANRDRWGLQWYGRCKDDILILYEREEISFAGLLLEIEIGPPLRNIMRSYFCRQCPFS